MQVRAGAARLAGPVDRCRPRAGRENSEPKRFGARRDAARGRRGRRQTSGRRRYVKPALAWPSTVWTALGRRGGDHAGRRRVARTWTPAAGRPRRWSTALQIRSLKFDRRTTPPFGPVKTNASTADPTHELRCSRATGERRRQRHLPFRMRFRSAPHELAAQFGHRASDEKPATQEVDSVPFKCDCFAVAKPHDSGHTDEQAYGSSRAATIESTTSGSK